MAITFSNYDVDFTLDNQSIIKNWITEVVKKHNKKIGSISYLFCSDEHIYTVNVEFLNHNTYTDIITFDYVNGNTVSGDIVISIDRVGENARSFGVPFEQELHRVVIHGILHLLGFKDKTDADAAEMRHKEDESLELYNTLC